MSVAELHEHLAYLRDLERQVRTGADCVYREHGMWPALIRERIIEVSRELRAAK